MRYMNQLYSSFGDKWRITMIPKTMVLGPSVSVWYNEEKYRNTDTEILSRDGPLNFSQSHHKSGKERGYWRIFTKDRNSNRS